jgi:predicted glycosyltransferase
VKAYGGSRGLRILRFMPGLAARLDEYDVVVTMAGYNACVELYQARARVIVLPRLPSRSDQVEQARKFHAYGSIDHVVDVGATSPDAFARLMERTFRDPPAPRKPLDLGGADATAALLHAELRRRASLAVP